MVSDDLLYEEDPDGLQTCLYYLRTILRIIEYSTGSSWSALASISQAEGKKNP